MVGSRIDSNAEYGYVSKSGLLYKFAGNGSTVETDRGVDSINTVLIKSDIYARLLVLHSKQ